MRLINAADRTFKSDAELRTMIREYEALLITANASTYECSILRDSLAQIRRVLAVRRMPGPKF